MMGFGMMGGGFFGLIIIVVIIYLIVNSNNGSSGYHTNNYTKGNNALEILSERYAKGEISEEEYLKKKKILKD